MRQFLHHFHGRFLHPRPRIPTAAAGQATGGGLALGGPGASMLSANSMPWWRALDVEVALDYIP